MIEFDLGQFLVNNFTTFRFFYDLYLTSSFSYVNSVGRYRARWTVDPALLESWGRRGLEVVAGNLDKVMAICREWDCRVTLVVYLPAPYHHDLIPNRTSTRVWGNVIYPWKTDQWLPDRRLRAR